MEPLKHECGVAMIRLRKPLSYYQEKYGTWQYGLNKLYLLMEKQHNRGQEGAGIACLKMQAAPGAEFMFRERALGSGAITEVFSTVHDKLKAYSSDELKDANYAEQFIPYAGEVYMGHLRYSTTGKSGLTYVHPFMRRNNYRARNLCICGNFSMTNMDDVFDYLTSIGQHPRMNADTYVMLEQVGHRLDRESERLYVEAELKGLKDTDITAYIEKNINLSNVLHRSAPMWDGGYIACGFTGSGELFSLRDPWGIRTAFWYADDEIMIVASERPVIQTAFNLETDQINELKPGEALFMSQSGEMRVEQILPQLANQACSFERIYFSRGSDRDIYLERKALGRQLMNPILKAVNGDLAHSVFSFIPNTAEVAFYGMTEGMDEYLRETQAEKLRNLGHCPTEKEIDEIINNCRVRREKVAIKDIKLRTFITEGNSRNDLAAHVYDITYGSIVPGEDYLVVIDDSIVRGTTLRESIIQILDRLHPKKMVIVSSSPQVRYPDYYGIDMHSMSEFIAFKAAVALLKDRGMEDLIRTVYRKCTAQLNMPKNKLVNYVKEIYAPFTDDEISHKIVELLRAPSITTPIEIVYQSLEGQHKACPNHPGDWYFSGDYPTQGGVKLVNRAFIEYVEENHPQFVE